MASFSEHPVCGMRIRLLKTVVGGAQDGKKPSRQKRGTKSTAAPEINRAHKTAKTAYAAMRTHKAPQLASAGLQPCKTTLLSPTVIKRPILPMAKGERARKGAAIPKPVRDVPKAVTRKGEVIARRTLNRRKAGKPKPRKAENTAAQLKVGCGTAKLSRRRLTSYKGI